MKSQKRISSGYFKESFTDRSSLSSSRPPRALAKRRVSKSGRDNLGHVSVRHQGGGQIRKHRLISTLDRIGAEEVKVLELHYDPNRTARLALVELKDGSKKYIIAQHNLKVGSAIKAGDKTSVKVGNRMMLKNIPIGTAVSDIQLYPEAKKFIARSAGTQAALMAVEGNYALLKLPSGELRKINGNCFATVGQVSNIENANVKFGKAGRKRRMGIRPSVRGKVMSPKAHPHGGGEGVNPIGLKYPKTPWGKIAIGKITRRSKKSDKFIVRRRNKK
jgi:large subunit ribosomal protein L2